MSNQSGQSSVHSKSGVVERNINKIPLKCWCGSAVVLRTSKSELNPGRRYYRCHLACVNKLAIEEHLLKWMDDALINGIVRMNLSIEKMEKHLIDLDYNSLEHQNKELEQLQLKMEIELAEKVESIVVESEWKMKKWVVASLFLGVIAIVGIMKL